MSQVRKWCPKPNLGQRAITGILPGTCYIAGNGNNNNNTNIVKVHTTSNYQANLRCWQSLMKNIEKDANMCSP